MAEFDEEIIRSVLSFKNGTIDANETRTRIDAIDGYYIFKSNGNDGGADNNTLSSVKYKYDEEFPTPSQQASAPEFEIEPERKTKYDLVSLKYPTEIQTLGEDIKHWVTFHISEVEASKYLKTSETLSQEETDAVLGPGYSSTKLAMAQELGAGAVASVAAAEGIVQTTQAAGDAVAGKLGASGAKFFKKLAYRFGGVAGTSTGAGAVVAVSNLTQRPKFKMLKKTISLYMPDTVMVSQHQNYQDVSFTEMFGFVGAAGQIGSAAYDEFDITSPESLKNIANSPGGREVLGAIGERVGKIGGIDLTKYKDALVRGAGNAINPQLELFFKGTERREYQFDFRFVSRSQKETQQIQEIIKAFRAHSSPSMPEGNNTRYFVVPSQFDIKFYFQGQTGTAENVRIPKIGTCVLERIDVNYVGSGKFLTFEDGQPIDIEVRLMFKEIDIMTREAIEAGY